MDGPSLQEVLSTDSLLDGRYQIERLLGAGGTGWVLLVKDISLSSERLALKLLFPHLLLDSISARRFRFEMQVAMRLSHPNIVSTYHLGRHNGQNFYITMEYVPGASLRARLEQGPIPFDEALSLLQNIACGLRYAHANGVVHRDLKPDNILIADDGTAKIADFGLAQSVHHRGEVTRVGSILGTPCYMSPEQLRSDHVDIRSDIYSLGILAYELVSGTPPFTESSFFLLAEQHLHEPLPPLSRRGVTAPEWFQGLIGLCTEKDKGKRIQSMEEVLGVLRQYGGASAQLSESPTISSPLASREALAVRQGYRKKIRFALRVWGTLTILALTWGLYGARNKDPWNRRLAWVILTIENATGDRLDLLRWTLDVQQSYDDTEAFYNMWEFKRRAYPLIETGMDLNFPRKVDPETGAVIDPMTPLHYLAQNAVPGHHSYYFEKQLAYGADPNIRYLGNTVLHVVIKRREHRMIQLALDGVPAEGSAKVRRADPNAPDSNGDRPLHLAIAQFDPRIAEMLLEAGADPQLENAVGESAVQLARRVGATAILKVFSRHGA